MVLTDYVGCATTEEGYTPFRVGSHQATQSLPQTHCIQKQLKFKGWMVPVVSHILLLHPSVVT
jgi:hypothetical protein